MRLRKGKKHMLTSKRLSGMNLFENSLNLSMTIQNLDSGSSVVMTLSADFFP